MSLATVLVALPSGVMGGGGIGFSDAESLLLKALREVRLSKLDLARQTIDELLVRYPLFAPRTSFRVTFGSRKQNRF